MDFDISKEFLNQLPCPAFKFLSVSGAMVGPERQRQKIQGMN